MKTNEGLQKDVQDAIRSKPLLNAAEIGVAVKDGVVYSYCQKDDAGRIAWNAPGARAVHNELVIGYGY